MYLPLEIENVLENLLNHQDSVRILYNHGLSADELYTNTPKRVIDKKWRWFVKYYGSTQSLGDAQSDPFKYAFHLILNKILDDRMRFKIPAVSEAYIDFVEIGEDKFQVARQNGAFPEIDFIESDFKAYRLNYFFRARGYQKNYPIYLGSDLKQKLINYTNQGIKLYSSQDFTMNDILPKVCERFKELKKQEVKSLLLHGFRRLNSAIKYGCAITINTTRFGNCYAYIGELSLNKIRQVNAYQKRRDRKLRIIMQWARPEFDGYYYIGLYGRKINEWLEENKKARVRTVFRYVKLRKIQEELYYVSPHVYIFRTKLKSFKGYSFWAEELKLRDLEYIGEVHKLKFTPATITWQQWKKEYEAAKQ